ncbi:MAG: NAD-dependent epimerase/dehydratase family protein [Candidatus Woesearchaeota archaeon]
MKNVLITGNAGFIGANLTRFLHSKGYNIRGIDNYTTGQRKYVPDYVDMRHFDNIVIYDNSYEAAENIDVIIHLAAISGVQPSIKDPLKTNNTNVSGTLNLLTSAVHQNVKKFIFASSGGTILGQQEPPVHEESKIKPISPYGASKAAGEHYCNAFYETYGLNTTILRFSNVYGPYSLHKKGNFIPTFLNAYLNDEDFYINGSGEQTRDFIYVNDVVNAIYKSMISDIENDTFQIATGTQTSINEVTDIMNKTIHEKTGKWKEVKNRHGLIGDVNKNYACIEKAELKLNWKPKYDIEDGIEEFFGEYI